ncbi:hypothetical protein D9M69_564450 [compost metagenome]
MRGHVAGRAGVAVVAPGAADLAALLEDQKVVDAGLLQLDGQAQAAEPGTDDQHLQGCRPLGVVMHCYLPPRDGRC